MEKAHTIRQGGVKERARRFYRILEMNFDDLRQIHKRRGNKKRRKRVEEKEKPFTSGKDSDRKPPICGQIAGGPATVDPISMSVSMCVFCEYWLVVNRWGWKRKA